jgi:hypothetical protein
LDPRSGFKLSSETFIVPLPAALRTPTCKESPFRGSNRGAGERHRGPERWKYLSLDALGTFPAEFRPNHPAIHDLGNFFLP